jgi:hypothetical protein
VAAEKRAKELAMAFALEQEETAQAEQRAIQNLAHMEPWEQKALVWIYHQDGHRGRASIHFTEIAGLSRMGLLIPEDTNQLATDRIWVIPEHVAKVIERLIGPPDHKKAKERSPWGSTRV